VRMHPHCPTCLLINTSAAAPFFTHDRQSDGMTDGARIQASSYENTGTVQICGGIEGQKQWWSELRKLTGEVQGTPSVRGVRLRGGSGAQSPFPQ
jgi:hypothetical protein